MNRLPLLSRPSIAHALALLSALAAVIVVAALAYVLSHARSEMLSMKRQDIRHTVEAAATIVRGFVARAASGEMSEAEARRSAAEALRAARFDDGNYFYVYDGQGNTVMHPIRKDLEGKNALGLTDPTGKRIVEEIVAIGRDTAGAGYTEFLWVKPGEQEPTVKIAYTAAIKEWNWLVGSGLHVHDVDAAFRAMIVDQAKVVVPLLLLFLALAVAIARTVAGAINRMTHNMNSLAAGNLAITVEGADRRDELGAMARAITVFRDNAAALQAAEHEKIRLDGETAAIRRQAEEERARTARELEAVVAALGENLARLAGGDLTARIETPFAPEYAKLKDDFNAAMAQLAETMTVIAENTETIRSGTGEISKAADDLSQRTEQQAASLEETAAALDEITATVRQTADNAARARQIVAAARSGAEASGTVVDQAIEAMGGIERSASEISQIIGVIDEIAFQTNLLALNAGVEAARAGDAGKGFAVVAQEVRALAQRSAEAAKEIKALIASSSGQVERGVDLVGETGRALRAIIGQVVEINETVSSIAASAQEQASGLQQVNSAVNDMDQTTQRNAAMVEETTAASRNLAQDAERLAAQVARFRTDRDAPAASPVHTMHTRLAAFARRA